MENMPMSLRALQHEHQFIVNTFASTMQLLARGPGEKPECFFDTLRSILFYLDEFPEQLHHRFESQILFPALIQENSSFTQVIKKLDVDHQSSEQEIRRLQHLLLVGRSWVMHAAFNLKIVAVCLSISIWTISIRRRKKYSPLCFNAFLLRS
jgi:hypothetical protein